MISEAKRLVTHLLEDDVIDNTFSVMCRLSGLLQGLATRTDFTNNEKQELRFLERLGSETIREALHKRELSITNAIIRAKNKILVACGVALDENHREIDPSKYSHNW